MAFERLAIPEVILFTPKVFGDDRGFFFESFNAEMFNAAVGYDVVFVQDNHSQSSRGVLRGLHYQLPPNPQGKLVRVTRGEVFDVAVDIRRSSPTFGRAVAVELSAVGGEQLFIPAGFAHGFCTLEPDTSLAYKVDAYYSAAHDRGIRWNDPALGIDWPVSDAAAMLSDKDRKQPFLSEVADLFD
jgi:dTDP-4-dehydrorhamnose 3,5-epimerase